MRKLFVLLAIFAAASNAMAATQTAAKPRRSLINDLDSLGSNKGIAERAKAIDADNRIRVVQNRTVDRTMRFEFGVNYGTVAGGDSYINTNQLGFMADFHIVPMISIGVRHFSAYNSLSSEGKRVFDNASTQQAAGNDYIRPAVDYPVQSNLATVTLYPLYGKLNFFNVGISQFDVYVLGGYGQMQTQSHSSPTYMGGGGVGIWWSQHFSSRIEARYQGYQDKIYSGTRDQGTTSFSVGIGFMI